MQNKNKKSIHLKSTTANKNKENMQDGEERKGGTRGMKRKRRDKENDR